MDTEGGWDFYDSEKNKQSKAAPLLFWVHSNLGHYFFVLMQLDTFEDFKLLHVLSHNTIESEFDLNRKIFFSDTVLTDPLLLTALYHKSK